MPRDANGNYSLPLPPVVAGTTIQTAWANPTMADLADGLSGSLSRLGAGGMLAEFKAIDGIVGAPGIGFNTEPTLGIYRLSTQDAGFAANGVQMGGWSPAYQLYVVRDYGGGPQKYAVADSFGALDQKYGGFGADGLHDEYTGDLNDILTNSRWGISAVNVTNAPVDFDAAGWGWIQTMMWPTNSDGATQIIYGWNGTNLYRQWTRQRVNTVWDGWVKVSDEGAFTTRLQGYGSNARQDTFTGDLDTILANSKMFIEAGGVTNEPTDFTDTGFVMTMVSTASTDEVTQVLYGQGTLSTKLIWMRSRIAGAWNAWTMVTSAVGLGAVYQFPGLLVPPAGQGMEEAAGQLLLRADYPALYDVAVNNGGVLTDAQWLGKGNGGANGVNFYSDGDGGTTFRIPDLRGEFLRSMADAATNARDPDRTDNSREWQVGINEAHTHTYDRSTNTVQFSINDIALTINNLQSNTGSQGGSEARPRNVGILTCIKVL